VQPDDLVRAEPAVTGYVLQVWSVRSPVVDRDGDQLAGGGGIVAHAGAGQGQQSPSERIGIHLEWVIADEQGAISGDALDDTRDRLSSQFCVEGMDAAIESLIYALAQLYGERRIAEGQYSRVDLLGRVSHDTVPALPGPDALPG